MTVEIQDRPPMRIATVPHKGPPQQIGQAFDRLMAWAGPKGVVMPPAVGVAVYLDDMSVVPPAEQRALAGITVGPEVAGDETVTIHEVPAGRYGGSALSGAPTPRSARATKSCSAGCPPAARSRPTPPAWRST